MPKKPAKLKYKKAEGAPKRFKSAFMFFSESRHREVREQAAGKKILASDVAKRVSQEWRSLAPDAKAIYEELSAKDRDRYYKEKAAYKGPWKVPDMKNDAAPKKPMSAFLAFSNERRKAVAAANPNLGNAEISRFLSTMWKESPEPIREQYRKREAEERAKFKVTIAEWEKGRTLTADSSCDTGARRPSAHAASCESHGQTMSQETPSSGNLYAYANYDYHQDHGALTNDSNSIFWGQPPNIHIQQWQSRNQQQMIEGADKEPFSTVRDQQVLALPPLPSSSCVPPASNNFGASACGKKSTRDAALPNASSTSGISAGRDASPPDFGEIEGSEELEPLIDTDAGGYLAAFAALESRNKPDQFHFDRNAN